MLDAEPKRVARRAPRPDVTPQRDIGRDRRETLKDGVSVDPDAHLCPTHLARNLRRPVAVLSGQPSMILYFLLRSLFVFLISHFYFFYF